MLYSIFILIHISLQLASFRFIQKHIIPVLSEDLKLHASFFHHHHHHHHHHHRTGGLGAAIRSFQSDLFLAYLTISSTRRGSGSWTPVLGMCAAVFRVCGLTMLLNADYVDVVFYQVHGFGDHFAHVPLCWSISLRASDCHYLLTDPGSSIAFGASFKTAWSATPRASFFRPRLIIGALRYIKKRS
jgi:hypothetical protein